MLSQHPLDIDTHVYAYLDVGLAIAAYIHPLQSLIMTSNRFISRTLSRILCLIAVARSSGLEAVTSNAMGTEIENL